MPLQQAHQRPGILTSLGVVSLIGSASALVGLVGTFMVVVLDGGNWFFGPIEVHGVLVFGWLAFSLILSMLLFEGGWRILRDDPSGIHLHRLWARINLMLHAVLLILFEGSVITSWIVVIYAVGVLHVTGRREVGAYFGLDGRPQKPAMPEGWFDDLA